MDAADGAGPDRVVRLVSHVTNMEDQARAIGATMQIFSVAFLIEVFAVGGTSRTEVDFVAPDPPARLTSVTFEETRLLNTGWVG